MSSSIESCGQERMPAVARRRTIATLRGAGPPLRCATARTAVTATFVRPLRNPAGAVRAPVRCGDEEAPGCGAAAAAAAVVAEASAVGTAPALSQDCEVEHCCAAVAPATGAAAAVAPAAPVAQPVYGVRGLASMSPAALLEAFRATCVGRVADAACTPQGKALLQAALWTQQAEVVDAVVAELSPRLRDVAVDVQGCHVLRTLVEACTAEQTEALIGAMHASVVLNMCITSPYTRRTLQSLFERREVDLSALVRVLADSAGFLAVTQQGCISLMRVFELCDAAQKAELVRDLLPKLAALSMDAFANYMVQCAIEHSDRATAAQYVVAHFAGSVLKMSCNKHSSNVLEVVLRCCGDVPAVRRLFLDELVFNPAALQVVVSDLYGNFVVQTLIGVVTNPMEFKRVEDRLRPALVGCQFAPKIGGKMRARRLSLSHAAGAVHHYSSSKSQHAPQQPQPCSLSYTAPRHGDSSSACVRGGEPCSSEVAMPVSRACVMSQGYCHHPYGSNPHTSRMSSAEQQLQGHMRLMPSGQVHPAEYFRFPIVERNAARAAGGIPEVDEADCGPVYGPSPEAQRRLPQRQQHPPPHPPKPVPQHTPQHPPQFYPQHPPQFSPQPVPPHTPPHTPQQPPQHSGQLYSTPAPQRIPLQWKPQRSQPLALAERGAKRIVFSRVDCRGEPGWAFDNLSEPSHASVTSLGESSVSLSGKYYRHSPYDLRGFVSLPAD